MRPEPPHNEKPEETPMTTETIERDSLPDIDALRLEIDSLDALTRT
mgnify:CR=1 FL=1